MESLKIKMEPLSLTVPDIKTGKKLLLDGDSYSTEVLALYAGEGWAEERKTD